MLSVNMYSLWKDDTSNIIKGIGEATNNIVNYRHSLNVTEKRFCELIEDVQAVCDFWTRNTYVGVPKETAEKEAKDIDIALLRSCRKDWWIEMKNVQISQELFFLLVRYFLIGQEETEPEIAKALEKKMDALVMRELYTQYKTAPTEEEKEKARREYLDKRGVPDSFRW